jgi:protease-4
LAFVAILVRVLLNALRVLSSPLWVLLRTLRRGRAPWVRLRIDGRVVDVPGRQPPWLQRSLSAFGAAPLSVSRVRELVDVLAADPRASGLLIEIVAARGGWAVLGALREEFARLRSCGKRVVVWLPAGGDQRELYLASAADEVWSAPPGSLTLLGPLAARTYLAPLLERLGVRIEVLAEGEYKTAAEPLSRESMSEREREQLSAMVRGLSAEISGALSARPGATPQSVSAAFDAGVLTSDGARQSGLIDGVAYEDELLLKLGDQPRARQCLPARRYLHARPRPLFLPLLPPSKVVILRIAGAIGMSPGRDVVGFRGCTAALRSLARDPQIAGVILAIDSPGGSAVASDLLHREIVALASKKPVVAWLGNVAASGGYYLAVGANHIVASPTTITGSIGVISARPVVSALLAQLGVRQEVVKGAPHADLASPHRELDGFERTALEAEVARYYARFLEVVAAGRKCSVTDIAPLAGGRIWTGTDAKAHALVDELGGYREARAALDGMLAKVGVQAAAEPVCVHPPLRDVTPAAPVQAWLGELGALFPELKEAQQLLELVQRGERVLVYASGWESAR